MTFQNDERVLSKVSEIFEGVIEKLKPVGGEWEISALFQPLPPTTKKSLQNGGNVLGTERFRGKTISTCIPFRPFTKLKYLCSNHLVFLCFLNWKDQSKKGMFQAAANQFVSDIEEFARSIGKDSPFKYLNYAHEDQNPLSTYGAENIAKMRAASAKYDPQGIFQTMVSGGFKVSKINTLRFSEGFAYVTTGS